MKTVNDSRNTEEFILSVARRLFLKKGMEATTMADIAREAGINRTLLNYYFRTKEKLFEGIFREIIGHFIPILQSTVESDSDVFEKLEAVIELYTGVLIKNPDIALFAANEAARDPVHFFAVLRSDPAAIAMFSRIRKEIQSAMRRGKLRKMPIEYFATTFLGLVIFPFLGKNIITGAFLEGNEIRFDQFARKRKKFVLESIRKIFDPTQDPKT